MTAVAAEKAPLFIWTINCYIIIVSMNQKIDEQEVRRRKRVNASAIVSFILGILSFLWLWIAPINLSFSTGATVGLLVVPLATLILGITGLIQASRSENTKSLAFSVIGMGATIPALVNFFMGIIVMHRVIY